MNKIADPGATFYVDDRGKPMSLAMNLFLLKFNSKHMLSKFVYFYLTGNYDYIVSFSSGTATPTITKDAVKSLRFPLPPLAEQHRIVAKIDQLMALCDNLEKQIDAANSKQTNLLNPVVTKMLTVTNNALEPRITGFWQGQVKIADDFDDTLEEVIAAFYRI